MPELFKTREARRISGKRTDSPGHKTGMLIRRVSLVSLLFFFCGAGIPPLALVGAQSPAANPPLDVYIQAVINSGSLSVLENQNINASAFVAYLEDLRTRFPDTYARFQNAVLGNQSVAYEQNTVDVTLCPTGSYINTATGLCTACPPGTYSETPLAMASSVCQQCPAGTYSNASGANNRTMCFNCPMGTYSSTPGALTRDVCIGCGVGATSAEGNGGIGGCQCINGYYKFGTACVACEEGYYCSGNTRNTCPNSQDIVPKSTSRPYSYQSSDCYCLPGFYGFAYSGAGCTACSADSYCTGQLAAGNEAIITSCPRNSASFQGSSSIDQCICRDSYRRQYTSPAARIYTITATPCTCTNDLDVNGVKTCSSLDVAGCSTCSTRDANCLHGTEAAPRVLNCKQGYVAMNPPSIGGIDQYVQPGTYVWIIAAPDVEQTLIKLTKVTTSWSDNYLAFKQCKFQNCTGGATEVKVLKDSLNRETFAGTMSVPINFVTEVGFPFVKITFIIPEGKSTTFPFSLEYTTKIPCDSSNVAVVAGTVYYPSLETYERSPFQPPVSWPIMVWLGDMINFNPNNVPIELRSGSSTGTNIKSEGLGVTAWSPSSVGDYWLVDRNYPSRFRQITVVSVDSRELTVHYQVSALTSSFTLSGQVTGTNSPDIALVVRDKLILSRLDSSNGVVIMSSYTNASAYTALVNGLNLQGQGAVGALGSVTLQSSLTWDTKTYSPGIYYYGSTTNLGTVRIGRIILSPASGGTTCAACKVGEYCYNGDALQCPANSISPPGSTLVTSCVCQAGYSRSTTDLDAYVNSQAVDSGGKHTCVVSQNGTLWCWGANDKGQLGLGRTSSFEASPVEVPGLANVKEVALGDEFTCVSYTNGAENRVKCWGDNYYGQLGLDSKDLTQTSPGADARLGGVTSNVVNGYSTNSLSCAAHSCCAVITRLSAKALTCWGRNHRYQLGSTSLSTQNIGTGTTNTASFTSPNEARVSFADMGETVGVGGRLVAMVTMAEDFACAMDSTGGVFCWGYNLYGSLGRGTSNQQALSPASNNINLGVSNGVALGAKTVNCYSYVCCVVMKTSFQVKCWGQGEGGRLGVGMFNVGTTPESMGLNLQSVKFGSNTLAMDVNVGSTQTCVLLSNNNVKCWGKVATEIIGDNPPEDMMQVLPNYRLSDNRVGLQISGKGATSCAVTSDYQVVCWGDNSFRQLGGVPNASQGNMTLVALPSGVSVLRSSGAAQSLTCVGCEVNTYCNGQGGPADTCPANMFSDRLATSLGDCRCLPGYELVSSVGNVSCNLCSGTKYCLLGSPNYCDPNSATTQSGSSDKSACRCDSGYYYANLQGNYYCTACPVGQYKNNVGNDGACQTCPDGTFNNQTGMQSVANCLQCRAGTRSVSGKHECSTCPAGTSSGVGSAACNPCGVGFYSDSGASTCTPCPAGTYDGEPQNGQGIGTCAACVGGKFSPRLNATSEATCQDCGEGFFSTGSASVCSACSPGTYSTNGSTSCLSCPANSTSIGGTGYSQCQCLAGFYKKFYGNGIVFTCEPCVGGEYAGFNKVGACDRCPAGTASSTLVATSMDTCKTCPPGSAAASGSAACGICPGATFSASPGASICSNCPLGSWAAANSTGCTGCVAGRYATGPISSYSQCLPCERGSYCIGYDAATLGNKPLIQPCPLGTYQNFSLQQSESACEACSPNHYCPSPTFKGPCPNGTVSNAGSTSQMQCNCQAGYTCNYRKVINAVVTLLMTKYEWDSNSDVRNAFIDAVARATGTAAANVRITGVVARSGAGGSRRLLGSNDISHILLVIFNGDGHGLDTELDQHLARVGIRATPDRAWIEPHGVVAKQTVGA